MQELLETLNLTQKEAVGILVMVGVIIVYWQLFKRLVVNKFVALFEAREQMTTGAKANSQSLIDTALSLESEVQASLDQARSQIGEERRQKVEEAKVAALKTIQEAEEKANSLIKETRDQLEDEYKLAQLKIKDQSDVLAKQLVEKIKTGAAACAALVLFASTPYVYAASGSGDHHHVSPAGLIPYAVNLFIFVTILFFSLRKPLKNGWQKRSANISKQIEASEEQQKQAEQKLAAAKEKFQSIDVLLGTLSEDSAAMIANETQAILKDSRDRAVRIREQGRAMAEAEKFSAKKSFRNELAKAVIEKTSSVLKSENNETTDKAFRKSSLDSLGALIN